MSRNSKQKQINKKISIFWKKKNMYNSFWINKLINCLVRQGRKDFVNNSVWNGLKTLKNTTKSPNFFLFEAFELSKPLIILKLERKGRQYYQVPTIIKKYRQYKIGIKWLSQSILRSLKGNKLSTCFSKEIKDTICLGSSITLKRKQLLYKVAVENRAYLHYRWQEN